METVHAYIKFIHSLGASNYILLGELLRILDGAHTLRRCDDSSNRSGDLLLCLFEFLPLFEPRDRRNPGLLVMLLGLPSFSAFLLDGDIISSEPVLVLIGRTRPGFVSSLAARTIRSHRQLVSFRLPDDDCRSTRNDLCLPSKSVQFKSRKLPSSLSRVSAGNLALSTTIKGSDPDEASSPTPLTDRSAKNADIIDDEHEALLL